MEEAEAGPGGEKEQQEQDDNILNTADNTSTDAEACTADGSGVGGGESGDSSLLPIESNHELEEEEKLKEPVCASTSTAATATKVYGAPSPAQDTIASIATTKNEAQLSTDKDEKENHRRSVDELETEGAPAVPTTAPSSQPGAFAVAASRAQANMEEDPKVTLEETEQEVETYGKTPTSSSSSKGNANNSVPGQPGAFAMAASSAQSTMEADPKVGLEETKEEETLPAPTNNAKDSARNTSATSGITGSNVTSADDNKHSHRQESMQDDDQIPIVAAEHADPELHHNFAIQAQAHNARNDQPEEHSAPMVVAELVTPPVQALEVVFDGDLESPNNPSDDPNSESAMEKMHKSFRTKLLWGLLVFGIIICITIPISIHFASQDDDNENDDIDNDAFRSFFYDDDIDDEVPILPPAPAPEYDYDCFTSTRDIFEAQYNNLDQLLFIVCPNTRVKMGILANPTGGDMNIIGGDVPLIVTRPNVEVRCGLDGSVRNNCVLDGGFLHILLQIETSDTQGSITKDYTSERTDNVTIQGITMTGQLTIDFTAGGASVVIRNPGLNVSLVDCLWENITAPHGLVFVGQAETYGPGWLGDLEVQEAELRIIDSVFRNITYDGGPIMQAWDQSLVVERCQFVDIRLSPFSAYCADSLGVLADENTEEADMWCQNLIRCSGSSRCSVQDICVDNFAFLGRAAIMVASYNAEVSLAGTNFISELQPRSVGDVSQLCHSGFAWLRDNSYAASCMDEDEVARTWMTTSTCSIGADDAAVTTTAPTSATALSYDCFTSTFDLIEAQYASPQQTLFIMCPNTHIKIGVFANLFNNDTRIIDGDVPMMIARPNVEVRCGEDGSVENRCVLDGGIVQVAFQVELPTKERFKFYFTERVDNVTVVGMTFTGTLASDSRSGAYSVLMSNAGSVLMDGCRWENMTAPAGIGYIGSNTVQRMFDLMTIMEPHHASLTVRNSTFRNIIYDRVLWEAQAQELTIEGCRFQDIRLSPIASQCDESGHHYCQTFLSCMGSICRIEDICIENFEHASQASLVLFGDDSQVDLLGTNSIVGVEYHAAAAIFNSGNLCPSGVVEIDSAMYPERYPTVCVESHENLTDSWTATASCSLV